MAEFALIQDEGNHSWNNAVAHATYADNVSRLGEETAQQHLRADIRSWIREQKGEESKWSLSLRDGKMMTETGVSLQEMTANITHGPHSHLVPESIKATAQMEAATLGEATRLAVAGADKIVLPEQHLDHEGNVVSRYLSVWTKNASDPTRYDGSRIDLGKNVRIEDVRTGTSFTAFEQQESVSFHQHKDEKRAFVLAIHSNSEDSFRVVKDALVTKVHRSHQETYSTPVMGERRQKKIDIREKRHTDMLTDVPRAVFREVRETAGSVSIFLRNKKEQINYDNERKSERLTLKKIREKPVQLGHVIEKRHIEMRRAVVSIAVIVETGVAIHAVPALLARLSEKLPAPIRAVEKSMRRHREKELRITNYARPERGRRELRNRKKGKNNAVLGRREMGEVKVEGKSPPAGEAVKKEKGKKVDIAVRVFTNDRIHTVGKIKERRKRVRRGLEKGIKKVAGETRVNRRLHRIMRRAERALESKRMPKREKKLWMTLVVAAAEFRKLVSQGSTLRNWEAKKRNGITFKHREILTSRPGLEARSLKAQKERVAIVGMRFAWMIWMMLGNKNNERWIGKNGVNSSPVESRLTTINSERKGVKLVHPKGEEKGEEKELTPWVLLSIIWYMTAIREQGMGNATPLRRSVAKAAMARRRQGSARRANTTSQQKKKAHGILPQHAVIFAYAS